ncbi:hypothetical protein SAMN05216403_1431 [Nitrosospira multiformis ATCC 25196]|nr:hypothetical protein SAMN05216403_1431 [Nitrosospira multiformis ATCC 25196]
MGSTSKEKKKKAISTAGKKLDEVVTNLVLLEFQSSVTTAQSGPVAGDSLGLIQNGDSTLSPEVVAQIHANFLDDDASGTLIDACVVALDRNRTGGAPDEELAKLISKTRAKVLDQIAEVERNRNQRSNQTSNQTELASAKKQLEYLVSLQPPSLGSICASMLKNDDLQNNFLLKLQEHKLHGRIMRAKLLTKQTLLRNCFESTKDIEDKLVRIDKYMVCVSKELK